MLGRNCFATSVALLGVSAQLLLFLSVVHAGPLPGDSGLGENLDDAAKYVREHVWVVVLGAIGFSLLVCAVAAFLCYRCRSTRGYLAIDGSVGGSRGFELSQSSDTLGATFQKQRTSARAVEEESALLNCQFYLRAIGGYTMKDQLKQIGTRAGKRWYMVTDQRSGQDLIMTMLGRSPICPLTLSKASVKTVQELVSTMRHAYLLPLLHVDYLEEQDMVTFIHPYVPKGSIKDHIYNCKPIDVTHQKYQYRGRPINEGLVRNYGRQVLEALIFLRSRGFPPCLHLHSGNVFVEGRSCRLTGYELALFGFPSRMYPLVRRAVKDDMDALEVILFGHFLYEMLAGQELNVPKAETQHISNARSSALGAQVLRDIFLKSDGEYPTLKELRDGSFFSGGVDVSEMDRYNAPPPLTGPMKSALKLVRKGKVAPAAAVTGPTGSARTRKRHSSASTHKSSRPSSRGNTNSTSPLPGATSRSPTPAAGVAATSFSRTTPAPPPPPAAPALPPPAVSAPPPSTAGRGALLSQIHSGSRLKKTKTNDRSAPKV